MTLRRLRHCQCHFFFTLVFFYFRSFRFIFKITKMLAIGGWKCDFSSNLTCLCKGGTYVVTVCSCVGSQLKVILCVPFPGHLAVSGGFRACHNREKCCCWPLSGQREARDAYPHHTMLRGVPHVNELRRPQSQYCCRRIPEWYNQNQMFCLRAFCYLMWHLRHYPKLV